MADFSIAYKIPTPICDRSRSNLEWDLLNTRKYLQKSTIFVDDWDTYMSTK